MAKGSAEFGYRYGGLSSQGPGYQQALGYDQENQKKKADQKEAAMAKMWSHAPSNYGPMPSDEQRKNQEEYLQARAEYHAQAAQERGARAQLLKQQEQDLRAGRIEGISVQGLYDQARTADNPKVKVQFFWQALACGHKAAAYDLYEAFHTGAGGAIRKNEEVAVTFAQAGRRLGEMRCVELCAKNVFKAKETFSDLDIYCRSAARRYGSLVTEEIIKSQVEEFDRISYGKFTPYNDIDKLINAPVESAGQDGDSHHCILM